VNNVRVQDARFQAAAYAYQDQVLTAGREVEDALIAFLLTQEQTKHLADSVTASNRTVEITNEQYVQGAVDFTPVFLFESTLTSQQDLYASSQGDVALALIAVYRALGGGWQIRLGNGIAGPQEVQMPTLNEMPLREAVDNDIEFQSVSFEATFGELHDTNMTYASGTTDQLNASSNHNEFPVRQL
jgi:hypothetical protein